MRIREFALREQAVDPNKLMVTVNMAGQTKEFDMTGRFQGSTKQQMDQASQFITDFCERKQMPQCQITVRFQGYRMNTTTSSAYMGAQPEAEPMNEKWSQKYKSSINCSHPRGFSQRAHCAGKKKHNESLDMEMTCPDCGMCEAHGTINEIKKGQKDSNGFTKCWTGYHAAGTKKGKNGGRVRNCVKNESAESAEKQKKTMAAPVSSSKASEKSFAHQGHMIRFTPTHRHIYRNNELVHSKAGNYSDPNLSDLRDARGAVGRLQAEKKRLSEGWQDTLIQAGQQARKAVDSAVNSIPKPFDEKEVAKDIQKEKGTANQKQVREMPARLRNDPEGHTIIPHGGMGSGNEETWRKIASSKLKQVAEMIDAGNYQGAEHVLFKNGYLEGAVRALARYEEFRAKQGKRKLAKGREIDLG